MRGNAHVRFGGRSGETGWLKGRYRAPLRSNYTGTGKSWIEEHLGWRVEVVRHPPHPRGEWVPHGNRADWRTVWFSYERLPPAPKVFRGVLPRRWVVERTFAWLCQNRRFSRDYERLCTTSEALIYAAMGRLMLRRLARN
jgi:putative transposase